MLLGDDDLVSRRDAEEERRDLEYEANEAIGKMEDRAITAEAEVKTLQRALNAVRDAVRTRAETAEALLSVAVDALSDHLCPPMWPTGSCHAAGTEAKLDEHCRPHWREELNRRLAAAKKPVAAAGPGQGSPGGRRDPGEVS